MYFYWSIKVFWIWFKLLKKALYTLWFWIMLSVQYSEFKVTIVCSGSAQRGAYLKLKPWNTLQKCVCVCMHTHARVHALTLIILYCVNCGLYACMRYTTKWEMISGAFRNRVCMLYIVISMAVLTVMVWYNTHRENLRDKFTG